MAYTYQYTGLGFPVLVTGAATDMTIVANAANHQVHLRELEFTNQNATVAQVVTVWRLQNNGGAVRSSSGLPWLLRFTLPVGGTVAKPFRGLLFGGVTANDAIVVQTTSANGLVVDPRGDTLA